MGSYVRHVGALLRRNLVFRKRAWLSSIFQLLLPSLMILILLLIKLSLQDNESFKPTTIPAVYPSDSTRPFSFLDYVSAILSPKKCVPKSPTIDFMDFNGDVDNLEFGISGINIVDWPVPFVKCNAGNCTDVGDDATSFCEFNILALAPKVAAEKDRVEAFKEYIDQTYPQILNYDGTYDIVQIFTDPSAIDDYVKDPKYGVVDEEHTKPKIALGVVIGGSDKEYEYSIRTNSTNWNSGELFGRPVMSTQPSTKNEFNAFAKQARNACSLEGGTVNIGPKSNNCNAQYIYNGALTIQRLVDDFIIYDTGAAKAGYSVAENGVSFADFPSREYVKDGFYAVVSPYVPLLLVLGLLYPFAAMCRSIVQEKEMRQKELMKMMSISESAIELSWFISLYGFSFLSGILVTIVSSLFYEKASAVLLFFFWQFAFISIVTFSMFLSACFFKTTRATLIGVIGFFAGFFLTLSANIEDGSRSIISLVSLHPIAALSYGVQIIGSLEDAGVGLVSTTLTFSEYQSQYNFMSSIGSFISSSLYFGFLSWYINRVFPGKYGQALTWNFLFTKSYWCSSKTSPSENLQEWTSNKVYNSLKIEPASAALKQQELEGTGVHIRGLTKQFGDKTAVSDLELSMYEGQVFALLGHNGAGKTTTINMLTGMTAPTNGYAIIDGKNINTQMPEIRENLGICLQHDCLFDQLTVKEHLQFFARVKGLYNRVSFDEAEESIENSIRDVALFEKRNTYSKDLSGGMKRKLSLAIAFCGDSKVVFLDEPTSGMDPFSRRFTWNVIRQNRQDRCIILTTHFMDEADLLGDRIGIMSEGQLRCLGSSLYLKKQFGVGYQLTIEKKSDSKSVDKNVADIITSFVPEAAMLSNVSSELSFQLPLDASSLFVGMFASLDSMVESEEISMYGVSITTLEEVFIMVARGKIGDQELLASSTKESFQGIPLNEGDPTISYRSQADMNDSNLFGRHVQSLLAKRALNFKRDKKAWACSTVLPCVFALLGFLSAKFASQFESMKPLDLNLSNYNPRFEGDAKRYPIPFNKAESFPCQPGVCISNFEGYSGYCGVPTNVNSTCYNIDVSDIADTMEDGNIFVVDQLVSSVTEASTQLPLNPENSKFSSSQYGAFYFSHSTGSAINDIAGNLYDITVQSLCELNKNNYTRLFDCSRFNGLGLVVSTNFTAPHASLFYQGLADEAIIKTAVGNDHSIKVTIDPLPFTSNEDENVKAADAFSAWFYLVLSFPFITGAFATFIVQERMSKAKHLQTVAGVKPSAYWLSSYLWDVCNYQFPLWIIVILMYVFDIESFTTSERNINVGTILLLLLFGPAAAGFTYITTFFFKSPSASNMFVIVFNFFIGFAGSLVVLILRLIDASITATNGTSNLKDIAIIIEWILRFIPSFNLAKGLLFSINIGIFVTLNPDDDINAFSPQVMLYEIIFLAWQSIVYISAAIYIDKLLTNQKINNWFCKSKKAYAEIDSEAVDEDVAAENERIISEGAKEDLIVLNKLEKQYSNGKVAVDGLSLGIPSGQCFGLLGINGAGKTTTMAMLTAEFPPTSGDATLSGYSVSTEPEETRRRIGYCPQFDAHFMNMTGREHVQLYAAIKGVPKDIVNEISEAKLAEVGLSDFDSDRLSSDYSGGMKRKLSVACATIGNPKIVFLDEPSTGMDPVSRRDLWKVISNMVTGSEKTSVILTTHSMEECEALCPRIGIMAGGKLKCIGSAQHLKTRFGQGYQVELKILESTKDDNDFNEIVMKLLQNVGKEGDDDIENGTDSNEVYLNIHELAAVDGLSGDTYLSKKITEEDPTGYFVYKSAVSNIGVSVTELAAFCATELRLRNLTLYLEEKYPDIILREREGTRMRFEVPSMGRKISSLFENIEENKKDLYLSEYGISQTTLEQVFNMHAAAAEDKKQGTDDG